MKTLLPIRSKQVQQHAHVFITEDESKAIIVTLHFAEKGGVLIEHSEPAIITDPIETNRHGNAFLSALRKTSMKNSENLRNRKLTDWPAFRASKALSSRQFELNSIPLIVSGADDANLIYTIEGVPFKDAELHIISSVTSGIPANELGERI